MSSKMYSKDNQVFQKGFDKTELSFIKAIKTM